MVSPSALKWLQRLLASMRQAVMSLPSFREMLCILLVRNRICFQSLALYILQRTSHEYVGSIFLTTIPIKLSDIERINPNCTKFLYEDYMNSSL
jgi:hypothetical protein